jgi:hypothetical protein
MAGLTGLPAAPAAATTRKAFDTSYPRTHTQGPQIKTISDITRASFVDAIERISRELGESWEIEPMSEGGIRRCGEVGYKSLRLHLVFPFPPVPKDVMDAWKDDQTVLYRSGELGDVFLRAYQRAPVWTTAELNVFRKHLEDIGMWFRYETKGGWWAKNQTPKIPITYEPYLP